LVVQRFRRLTPPTHIVRDKGRQFWCTAFKRWCSRRKIKPRFEGVGRYGSLAVIERCIRTLKEGGLGRILIPQNHRKMR
jgi:transposase InsO family protein